MSVYSATSPNPSDASQMAARLSKTADMSPRRVSYVQYKLLRTSHSPRAAVTSLEKRQWPMGRPRDHPSCHSLLSSMRCTANHMLSTFSTCNQAATCHTRPPEPRSHRQDTKTALLHAPVSLETWKRGEGDVKLPSPPCRDPCSRLLPLRVHEHCHTSRICTCTCAR